MVLSRILSSLNPMTEETPKTMTGKIFHLNKGWGFISSPELEYTRIFFHWQGLAVDTLPFKELKVGMKVTFDLKELEDKKRKGEVLHRAVKVKVIEGE